MHEYRIVPAEPTDAQLSKGEDLVYSQTLERYPADEIAANCYRAMLSAAPPFEWPEEAVLQAGIAVARVIGLNDDPSYAQIAEAALNAALKVLEGRDG